MTKPLLTISIPTYQRASYLEILLEQLYKEVASLDDPDNVEVVVSDNASLDSTYEVAQKYLSLSFNFRYIKNTKNLGSDFNIAQAFNEATGRYVLIMGDDDILVDGELAVLLSKLEQHSPSVMLLKAYGYDKNFRNEFPSYKNGYSRLFNVGDFLQKAGAQITLISACVIQKDLIKFLDAKSFVGNNLVQVHLVLSAIFAYPQTMVSNGYVVACKRNNSGGYIYAQVFVKNLGDILDTYKNNGLSDLDIVKFENYLLKVYHPYYVWKSLSAGCEVRMLSKMYFKNRFDGRLSYSIFIAPQFFLPVPLGWFWGLFMIVVGRIFFADDFIRGLFYLKNKIKIF